MGNVIEVFLLMYADDIVLVGDIVLELQRKINIIEIFFKKWDMDVSLNPGPKSTGLFPPGEALEGVFHPLCKIRSRHARKLKFTGLIAYIMFYKIYKFENLTIINDVIVTSLPKTMAKFGYLTLTSIKFDPDNQEI